MSRSTGTKHVLLGLIRIDDGLAVRLLEMVGLDPHYLRTRILQEVAGTG